MLIDTHAHLNDDYFKDKLDKVSLTAKTSFNLSWQDVKDMHLNEYKKFIDQKSINKNKKK